MEHWKEKAVSFGSRYLTLCFYHTFNLTLINNIILFQKFIYIYFYILNKIKPASNGSKRKVAVILQFFISFCTFILAPHNI